MIFNVSADERFELSSTSKGNQIKWFKDGMYIKADTMGYEGFAEALTSELLHYVITDYDFIDYFLCNIQEGSRLYKGCYSINYLGVNESFISVYRLLQSNDRAVDRVLRKKNGKDLVNYVVDTVESVTKVNIMGYLGFVTKFDALVLNEDRHLNNINLVFNSKTNRFRLAPIFDNGLSLLSDTNDYPLDVSLRSNLAEVKSKPFATSFEKQISYFNTEPLVIDIAGFNRSLEDSSNLFQDKETLRARNVLLRQLRAYKGRLWKPLG